MEKLRPEQRKLWRRAFLDGQARGWTPDNSAKHADDAVAEWEKRGAFEEEPATATFARPFVVAVHVHVQDARESLLRRSMLSDVAVAVADRVGECSLIALTPRGHVALQDVFARGFYPAMYDIPVDNNVGPNLPGAV